MFSNQMSKTITTINNMLSKSTEKPEYIINSKQRLQDKQLQEMSDMGMCLSMHQVNIWFNLKDTGVAKQSFF